MYAKKTQQTPSISPLSLPDIPSMPTGERDFTPELHRSRLALDMTSLFGEFMSKKTANTSDARQKRGR
jgi:hypothetical protein